MNKEIEILIEKYNLIKPKGFSVKYIPKHFASIEIFNEHGVRLSVLQPYEFRQKIDRAMKENKKILN